MNPDTRRTLIYVLVAIVIAALLGPILAHYEDAAQRQATHERAHR